MVMLMWMKGLLVEVWELVRREGVWEEGEESRAAEGAEAVVATSKMTATMTCLREELEEEG